MKRRWMLVTMAAVTAMILQGAVVAAPEGIETPEDRGILVNPNPAFSVRVWVDKDPSKGGNPLYLVGNALRVFVQTNRNAYLYIFNIQATGQISAVLPNRYERQNLVRAGVVRSVPGPGAGYELTVAGPAGQDRIFVVASTRRLSMGRIGNLEQGIVSVRGADDLGRSLTAELNPVPRSDWVTDFALFRVVRGDR